jgi:hypothetical protein
MAPLILIDQPWVRTGLAVLMTNCQRLRKFKDQAPGHIWSGCSVTLVPS